MIRNGLYSVKVEIQDGIEGGDNGVVVLRDGTIRGGNSFFISLAPTAVLVKSGKVK